jgi:MFS family permease
MTVELTSHHWAQFTVGRIIAYFAVGLVENAVPAYNAETSPAATRGLLSGSIILVSSLGNLWGSGMSRAYATTLTAEGWIIPTAMQFIPAVGILALVPFTPESPRWLLLKGRRESAMESLVKIRHKHEVDSGAVAAEVDALDQMIEESRATDNASWLELLRGNYLRRTWVSKIWTRIQKG